MDTSSFTGLLQNAALLLALGIIYDSLGLHNLESRRLRELISGVLIGLLGIALMHTPWEMTPGVFFDTRWILISLSGLFFGFVPTLIAVVMTVTLRITQGGAGIMVGSLVIILPALMGLVWRHVSLARNIPYNWWRLYLLGLLVQITVLCLMLLMPKDMRFEIIRAIAPTLLSIFPIGTMLLGLILRRQYVRRQAEQEVLASRKKLHIERSLLRCLLDTIPDHIFVKDKDGRYLAVNKAFQEFHQIPEKSILGKTDSELFDTRLNNKNTRIEKASQDCNCLQTDEFWLADHNSEEYLFEVLRTPYYDLNSRNQGIVGINHDITLKRQAEEQVLTLSQAIEQSPVSVVITTMDGEIEYVNSHFEKATGYTKAEAIGLNSRFLKSGRTPEGRYKELWQSVLSGKSWQGEFQNQTKAGQIFWEQAHIAPVLDSNGQARHLLAVKQDITHQKEQEEKILYQAHFDSLTDLPNRFLSLNRLEMNLKQARRDNGKLAVLFLDLDDFKKVNDSYGHSVGDSLLLQAAKRLQSCLRDTDTVGRLGGDEFIIIINLNHTEEVESIASLLLETFREPLLVEQRELLLTVSIGAALYPEDGDDPAELLRRADSAMYFSKEQGRNSFHFFTAEMNVDLERRVRLEEQMHNALLRGEFELLYQPVINLSNGRIVGAEALLRWHSQALGLVCPDEFIPIAEKTGLIVNIGRYVLEEALRSAQTWMDEFCSNFHIAVNISPRQFRDSQLVEHIDTLLQRYNLRGSILQLEITEGVLMARNSGIEQHLEELSQLGIKISMDDFGTGYSSLSYLRNYPFDILKIDRSFVEDITVDPSDLELVNATIDMAHGLGLSVVAEGVETPPQKKLLMQKGCEYAQGNLFSEPVSAAAFTALLRDQANA